MADYDGAIKLCRDNKRNMAIFGNSTEKSRPIPPELRETGQLRLCVMDVNVAQFHAKQMACQ